MYIPAHFDESRPALLQTAMHAYPFATLVNLGSAGLNANHLPFEFDPEPTPHGTLRGHVSRANPLCGDLAENVDALVIFQGPQGYVSPSWYASKEESGKVVPTWNYVAVHASGPLRMIEDRDWLLGLVTRLTNRFEAASALPWKVDDAPPSYIEAMLRGIIGLEIPIRTLVGKWKLSQNRSAADRLGVIDGLGDEQHLMADMMKRLSD